MSMWFSNTSFIGKAALPVSGEEWFNADRLPSAAHAKVRSGRPLVFPEDVGSLPTLLHFWDYGCIHCLETLPYLRRWWQQYREVGLLLIGIHTPEFEFGKDADKVQSAVLRFSLPYPVVSDAAYETWARYGCTGWPRTLLINSKGVVVFDKMGADGYAAIEKDIQALLKAANPQISLPAIVPTGSHRVGKNLIVTEKIYVGYLPARCANSGGLVPKVEAMYTLPARIPLHHWAVQGVWLSSSKKVTSCEDGEVVSSLLLRYQATMVAGLIGTSDGRAARVEVRRDDEPLTLAQAGDDVRIESGHSYVNVGETRAYNLLKDAHVGEHQLELIPLRGGVDFYTFMFSGE